MGKPRCNGVQMCREEQDFYLRTATYTLACTNMRCSVSNVMSDPSMSSCGECKTIFTRNYELHHLSYSEIRFAENMDIVITTLAQKR